MPWSQNPDLFRRHFDEAQTFWDQLRNGPPNSVPLFGRPYLPPEGPPVAIDNYPGPGFGTSPGDETGFNSVTSPGDETYPSPSDSPGGETHPSRGASPGDELNDVYLRLMQLVQLYESGVINFDEFEAFKARLIPSY